MKIKFTLILTALVIATACKKDYTCSCGEGMPNHQYNSRSVFTVYDTYKNAKKKCDSYLQTNNLVSYPETFCEIK